MKFHFPSYPNFVAILVTLIVSLIVFAAPAHAGGEVTDCLNDDDLYSKLAGGGLVTFNCGNSNQAATIVFGSGSSGGTKIITSDTTIDGEFLITLSGGFGNRLFKVENSNVTLTLKNITLINGYNPPDGEGGTAVLNKGHLVLDHVTIHSGVDSNFNGGAVATYGALDANDSIFHDNKARNGGAIFASGAGAVVTITDTVFYQNKATGLQVDQNGFGGAIYGVNGASVNITAGSIYGNSAASGGGILMSNLSSSLKIQNSQIHNNSVFGKGGGILNASTANLSNVMISGNVGEGNGLGGGIYNYGNLTLYDVTLNNNTAYYGAGMSNAFATADLKNVTISNNSATAYGGGLDNIEGTVTLTNVTLSGNSANSGGGGIFNENTANTKLNLRNVIVSNSKSGGNCRYDDKLPLVSENNLSSDATCHFGAGDNARLKLGKLETNGGLTLTHRLLPGSAAIDKGEFISAIQFDQRGVPHQPGSLFDVGAVEFVPCPDAPTKPALLSPKGGQELTTQIVVLDWAGPDCVKTFSVELRRDRKDGTVIFAKAKIKPTQVSPPTLAKNHKYFWRVTACKGTQCTTSGWGKFKVQ